MLPSLFRPHCDQVQSGGQSQARWCKKTARDKRAKFAASEKHGYSRYRRTKIIEWRSDEMSAKRSHVFGLRRYVVDIPVWHAWQVLPHVAVTVKLQWVIGHCDRCFAAAGPLVWNSLPAELRQCHSLEQFKRRLKTQFSRLWDHGASWLFSKTAPHRNSLT